MECCELLKGTLIIFCLTLFCILMFYLASRETSNEKEIFKKSDDAIEQSKKFSYERKLILLLYRVELALFEIKAKESLLNNTTETKSNLVDFKFENEDALTKLRGKTNGC